MPSARVVVIGPVSCGRGVLMTNAFLGCDTPFGRDATVHPLDENAMTCIRSVPITIGNGNEGNDPVEVLILTVVLVADSGEFKLPYGAGKTFGLRQSGGSMKTTGLAGFALGFAPALVAVVPSR